jgi:hypothetical protein
MEGELNSTLEAFAREKRIVSKGPLSVMLVVTQHAKKMGLPLDPARLVTEGSGQVLGLGQSAVQAILKRHDIMRILASEGGRTSRGSIGKMQEYVSLLNQLAARNILDLDYVELFWIDRVRLYFNSKPLKLRLDPSQNLRAVIRDVLDQAAARQKSVPGVQYVGAVMQHLAGAKLDCAVGRGAVAHNCFSTSDAQTSRAGDFLIGDVAIHVTSSPSESLIQKCRENLDCGLRPILITMQRGVAVAEELARNASIEGRVDVFEIEQFIALNLYELGKFAPENRGVALKDIVYRYNELIDEWETDPGLKLEMK